MSVFVKIFDCPNFPVSIPDALRSLVRQDDDGGIYLNIHFNQRNNCDDYSIAYDCLQQIPVEEMIKDIIVEDECGDPALNVLVNICDVCPEEQIQ